MTTPLISEAGARALADVHLLGGVPLERLAKIHGVCPRTLAKTLKHGEAARVADSGGDHPRNILHRPEPTNGVMDPHRGIRKADGRQGEGANPRDVWTIPPEQYRGDHYASYPTELPRRCIEAATSPAVCAECGAPHAPVVERGEPSPGERERNRGGRTDGFSTIPGGSTEWSQRVPPTVTGYRPTCQCSAGIAAAIVLDPFAGTGATGVAAIQLGRRFIGIDLSAEYLFRDARQRVGAACVKTVTERRPTLATVSGPLFEESA